MGVLSRNKNAADAAHSQLAPAIPIGLAPTHAMTGSLEVTTPTRASLFTTTANFSGGQHVELQLMGALHAWTKSMAPPQPFVLPASSRVYLYVYDSPCPKCVTALRMSVHNWRQRNPSTVWKLGFTRWWIGPSIAGIDRYANHQEATQAYNGLTHYCGMRWKLKA